MTTPNTKISKKEIFFYFFATLIASLLIHYAYFSQAIPDARYLTYLACNVFALIPLVVIFLSKKALEEQSLIQSFSDQDITRLPKRITNDSISPNRPF
jgi:hypothetical protein